MAGDSVPPCISLDAFLVDDRHSLLEALWQISLLAKSGGLSQKYPASTDHKTAQCPSGHPWFCNGAGEVSRGHRSLWTGDQPGEQAGWKRTCGSLLRNFRNDQLGGQAGWKGLRTSPIYGCKILTLYSSHQESKRTLQKWRQTCATNMEWIFRGKEQSELWWNQLAWMESHVDFGHVEGPSHLWLSLTKRLGFWKAIFKIVAVRMFINTFFC